MAERDLDVAVFGATGVTGRRIVAYLAERAPETGARWAAVARDAEKLNRLLDEEGIQAPETLIADAADPASLAAIARRSRVVLNAVGPFSVHGRPLIEACVAEGAHYADLTGEIPFVRQVIDEFDARAAAAGTKIVQVCGFECVPADLAVLIAAEKGRQLWDEELVDADLQLRMQAPPRMRPSDGGGVASVRSILAVMSGEDSRRIPDPAALITDERTATEVRRRSPITVRPRYEADWTVIAPIIPLAFIGPAVIHRTAALIATERGVRTEPFRYREGFALPGSAASLPLRYAAAGALAGTQGALGRLATARPAVRQRVSGAVNAILPKSGIDPPVDRQAEWTWGMSLDARTGAGHEIRVQVDSEGHLGYLATGRIMGEAGLLLAEPGATPERAGCLTPATALGTASAERFERARLRFSVST